MKHVPIQALAIRLLCAAATAVPLVSFVACDPGTVCEVHPDADVPPGVDPCAAGALADTGVTDATPDTDAARDAGAGDGGPRGDTDRGYAPGPFGVEEGDTVADLSVPTAAGGTFSFGDVYRDDDVRLVLVSTAAGWCTACREEQPALVELFDEYEDDGLLVVVAIFEDDFSSPVTPEYASGWTRQYGLDFPVLVDARNQFGAFYDSDLAPMNLFIDGETMEIIQLGIGFDEGVARALIADRL